MVRFVTGMRRKMLLCNLVCVLVWAVSTQVESNGGGSLKCGESWFGRVIVVGLVISYRFSFFAVHLEGPIGHALSLLGCIWASRSKWARSVSHMNPKVV